MSQDTFRQEYTALSPEQSEKVLKVKRLYQDLHDLLEALTPEGRSENSRCMAIAKTNLEQSGMWAVKALTSPEAPKE